MLKLKNVCIIILGLGFLSIALGFFGIVFSNQIIFIFHITIMAGMTQLILGGLAYCFIFWKQYKFKGIIPFFLVLFVLILHPFSWIGAGQIQLAQLKSDIVQYDKAVEDIREIYGRQISVGQDFIADMPWFERFAYKVHVRPRSCGTFVVEFYRKDVMTERAILFVENGLSADWEKIEKKWKGKKEVKPQWYSIYKEPQGLEEQFVKKLFPNISRGTCPYSRPK